MALISLAANVRPSIRVEAMRKHRGDVSEGATQQVIAKRIILGRKVTFYRNGEHEVAGCDLTPDQHYHSELMRFAHASILAGVGVGDKSLLYVDATINPAEVWIYGRKSDEFIRDAEFAINAGTLPVDLVVDGDPVQELRSQEKWPA